MTENPQNPVLIELTADLKDKFLAMAEDFHAAGENRHQVAAEDFAEFLNQLEMYRTGVNLPEGYVGYSAFYLFDGEKLLGSGNLRHELNENLAVYGGHIGYTVRPSERGKGYGSLILQLTLEKARKLGFKKVFITCDADNIASVKIIEKNGGKLENQMFYEPSGKLISQYWIQLEPNIE